MDAFDTHFGKTADHERFFGTVAYHIIYIKIAECRGSFRYRDNSLILHLAILTWRFTSVIHIKQYGFMQNIAHADVFYKYILHHTATAAGGFKTQTNIGTDEGTVGYKNIPGPARHFAAYHKTAVRPVNHIVTHDHILS